VTLLRRLSSLLEGFLRRPRVESEMEAELRFHLERRADDLAAAGLARPEAERRARLELGGLEGVKERCRDARGLRWANELSQDLRFGLRTLLKQPVFCAVAVLTLGLGIGANSAIFSFIKKAFIDPLPYRDPGRLVMVWQDYRQRGGPEREWFSYPNFRDYRAQSRSLADLAVFADANFVVTGRGEAEAVGGALVSPSFFDLLGVRPVLGRGFLPAEERPGAGPVAILGHGYWQRRYGGDPGIVGKAITVDDRPHVVVGVLPAELYFPAALSADLFAPLERPADASRGDVYLRAIGRLRAGVALAQARGELAAIAARIIRDNADAVPKVSAAAYSLRDEMSGKAEAALLVLLATVGLVLLIACANVANLLLARATARRGELSVRAALGASQGRLVRQLLVESVLLAVLGGCLGVVLAWGGVGLLKRVGSAVSFPLPQIDRVGVDAAVLGFTLLVSILTGLLFGLAPALEARRSQVNRVLQEGAGAGSGRVTGRRAGQLLVVIEIALALTLAVGSGLLLRSLYRLQAVDPGYDAGRILAFGVQTPATRYPEDHQVAAFHRSLVAKLESLPGVISAGAVSALPLGANNTDARFIIEGSSSPQPDRRFLFWYRSVTPGYFKTVRLPVLRGRGIAEQDRSGAPKVAVINRAAARQYFPGEDPIGRTLRGQVTVFTIVGVVENARSFSLAREEPPALYLADDQIAARATGIAVRTAGNPGDLAGPVRAVLGKLDPAMAAINLQPLAERVAASLLPERALGLLVSAFGALALILAAIGLYGLMSYLATQRTREIGIRMAIGAGAATISRLVLRQALRLVAAGILAGLLASLALTRLLKGVLFEVGPLDPPALAAGVAVLVATALVAAWVPAWRASRLDPAAVLRG
jgi:putative ABC transport system permease protein